MTYRHWPVLVARSLYLNNHPVTNPSPNTMPPIVPIENLLPQLPTTIIVVIALMWASQRFLLPFLTKYKDQHVSDDIITQVRAELDNMRREMHDCEGRYNLLDQSYRDLQLKYTNIIGVLRGFQIYLRDKGMADFPLMDELVRHSSDDK